MSVTGVIGGFFRELVDVDSGLWPTFVGLTLRPGETLRQYLSGIRKGLTSPGRYLLAAVMAEALAVRSFLVAHASLLATGLNSLSQAPASLYAGHPVESSAIVGLVVYLGYIGFASYRCFGPGWISGLKGMVAVAWSLVEAFSILAAGMVAYVSWLI